MSKSYGNKIFSQESDSRIDSGVKIILRDDGLQICKINRPQCCHFEVFNPILAGGILIILSQVL